MAFPPHAVPATGEAVAPAWARLRARHPRRSFFKQRRLLDMRKTAYLAKVSHDAREPIVYQIWPRAKVASGKSKSEILESLQSIDAGERSARRFVRLAKSSRSDLANDPATRREYSINIAWKRWWGGAA
jgi:hypothetical protein